MVFVANLITFVHMHVWKIHFEKTFKIHFYNDKKIISKQHSEIAGV